MPTVLSGILDLSNVGFFDGVALATLLASGYIAYRSKANSLRDVRDEERFLNDRLEDASFIEEPFAITIDRVEVEERDTRIYRLKRMTLRPIEGTSKVTVRWEHHGAEGSIWESDYGDILKDSFPYEINHIGSEKVGDKTFSAFELNTLDSDEIAKFAASLPKFMKIITEEGDHLEFKPVSSRFQLK